LVALDLGIIKVNYDAAELTNWGCGLGAIGRDEKGDILFPCVN